ncbi:MAG: hypothetical protein V9F82_05250 [Dermatophilaceae bacterium]
MLEIDPGNHADFSDFLTLIPASLALMGFSEIEEVVSAGEQLMDGWFLLSDSQYPAWLHHAAAHDVRSPSGNCERIGLVSGETNIDQALVRLDP